MEKVHSQGIRAFVRDESLSENETNEQEIIDLCPVDATYLLNNEMNSIPCLFGEIVPRTGLISIVGSSDTGKSALMRQMAICIVKRLDFLGFKNHARLNQALYISTEDSADAIAVLLKMQNQTFQFTDLKGLQFEFDYENLLERLKKHLEKEKYDCIFIDAFSDVFPGQINQSNEVRRFLVPLGVMANKHDTLIVILHHTGKRRENDPPSKNNIVGSQSFEAKMRMVMELRQDQRESTQKHLCIVKGNYLSSHYKKESFVLKFTDHMVFEDTGRREGFESLIPSVEAVTEVKRNHDLKKWKQAYDLEQEGLSQREIAKKLNISVSTVNSWIHGYKCNAKK